jgi:hypothetical protein
MEDVVRVDCVEALVTPELRVVSERTVSFYVKVPALWVADGTIPPHYRWSLDIPRLLRGDKLWTIIDRLHLALMARYQRAARAGQAERPDDPNRTLPIAVEHRLVTAEERAGKPWLDTESLRLTETGELLPAAPADL